MLVIRGEGVWQLRSPETGERIVVSVERQNGETKVGIDADRDRWAIEQIDRSRLDLRA